MAIAESLLVGVLVFSLIKLYHYLVWKLKVDKMLSGMNGPKGLPILGLALEVLRTDNILEFITNRSSAFGSPAKAWFGPLFLMIHVDDPKNVKTILNSDETLDKAEFYRFVRLGNTIFANKKEVWKGQRKALNTMRNKNKLFAYNPLILRGAQRLVKSLKKNVDGPEFDVFNYIGAYIIEVVFEASFDVELNALDNPEENEIIHKIEM